MVERTPGQIARIAISIALGLAVGFAVGWWLWPVTYTNTSPAALRQDYYDDYVLMVATAYEAEEDPQGARSRLELLNPEEPAVPALELTHKLIEEGGSDRDIWRLARLAQALGATDPVLAPLAEGAKPSLPLEGEP